MINNTPELNIIIKLIISNRKPAANVINNAFNLREAGLKIPIKTIVLNKKFTTKILNNQRPSIIRIKYNTLNLKKTELKKALNIILLYKRPIINI